jgi:hypothetical protein
MTDGVMHQERSNFNYGVEISSGENCSLDFFLSASPQRKMA